MTAGGTADPPAAAAPAPPFPARQVLVVAVFLGLVSGSWESLVIADRSLRRGEFVFRGTDYPWTSPLGHVAWFVAAALGLLLLRVLLPRRMTPTVMTVLLASTCAFAVVANVRPIAGWSKAVLALGIGFQAGRFLAARLDSLLRTSRRGATVLAATVAAVALAVAGHRSWTESEALAALPPATPGRPNVLLVVLDTVRAQSLSLHGHDRATSPNLDRLAREGATFERTITTAPWTLPSHAAMFTGCWHHEVGTTFKEPLDDRYPTLAESFAHAGYATAGFVGNVRYATREVGLARGFARFEDYWATPGEILFNCSVIGQMVKARDGFRRTIGFADDFGRKHASRVNSEFLSWLDGGRPQDRPFFAFLNYYDAHHPYVPPPGFAGRWGDPSERRIFDYAPGRESRVSKTALAAERDAYECAIAFADDRLGALFAELAERGIADDTVIAVTSDHGEAFGEHGCYGHTDGVYVQQVHVPFVLRWPRGVPAGTRVSDWISLRHLPATLLDLADVTPAAPLGGTSLAPLWNGRRFTPDRRIYTQLGMWSGPTRKAVLEDGMRLHVRTDPKGRVTEELYDLRTDPREETNVIDDPAHAEVRARLRRAIDEDLAEDRAAR